MSFIQCPLAEALLYIELKESILLLLTRIYMCPYPQCCGQTVCLFLLSTYTDGQPPDSAVWFTRWVADSASDFRVDKSLLSGVYYAVFALGNSLYTQHYNTVGRELYHHLHQLSARPVYPLGLGDQNVAQSKYGGKTYISNRDCIYTSIKKVKG